MLANGWCGQATSPIGRIWLCRTFYEIKAEQFSNEKRFQRERSKGVPST